MSSPDVCFPVFKKPMEPSSVRTMDEIDSWIEQDYPFLINRERYEKEKRSLSVNLRFTLD